MADLDVYDFSIPTQYLATYMSCACVHYIDIDCEFSLVAKVKFVKLPNYNLYKM